MTGDISPLTAPISDQQDNISAALWRRYDEITNSQSTNNALIEELLIRYDVLTEKHISLNAQYGQLSAYNAQVQMQMEENTASLQNFQNYFNRGPFVLVLIDGDGMIFQESLLAQGEAGGKIAAGALENGIINAIHAIFRDNGFPAHFKVIARVYANVKGLADVCHRAGLVSSPSDVEDF
ncbi:hypothetical protein LTS18_002363, partial [Coniosporium uncinatum]